MDFTFKASEITCNGTIGGCALALSEENETKLKSIIIEHLSKNDRVLILKDLEKSGTIDKDWVVGSRTESVQTLYCRMVSGLIAYGLKKFGKNGGTYKAHRETSEMWINAQVSMMNYQDAVVILEKALADCARADHWYSFEKQWA